MNNTQKALLGMLLEIDEICRKHEITYYLVGGSALGAIRHKGFLPWDDDADIVLTKENWDKLEQAFKTDLPENRVCMGWNTHKGYPSVFYRYADTTKTCIVHSLCFSEIEWGAIIDIFVLAPLPVDQSQWETHNRYVRRFGELVVPFLTVNEKTTLKDFLVDKLCAFLFGRKRYLKYLYDKIMGNSPEACTHYSYVYPRVHLVYPKEVFQKPRYAYFEGHLLPIPTLVEEHFRILFGDDWYMVPSEDQIIHHGMVVDTKRSYTQYMDDYMSYTNRKQYMKDYFRYKLLKIRWNEKLLEQNHGIAICRAAAVGLFFCQEYQKIATTLEKWFTEGNIPALMDSFAPYYHEQLNPLMLSNNVFLPVPERFFELAVKTITFSGYSKKAGILLEIYNTAHSSRPQWAADMEQYLQDKKQAFLALETRDYEKAETLASALHRIAPADKDILLMLLYQSEKKLTTQEELQNLLTQVLSAEERWTCGYEFTKLRGDILHRLGDFNRAEACYQLVKQNSRNGLLQLALSQHTNEIGVPENG